MKWLIVVFLLLVAGAILGPVSSGNAGYVLLQFAGWSVETSVIALFIITVVAVVVISVVVGLVKFLLRRGRNSGKWFSQRSADKAKAAFRKGQLALLEQDYLQALQAFEKAYKRKEDAAYAVFASYSAQQLGELGKAEFWRSQAGKEFEQADQALKLKYINSLKDQQPTNALRLLDDVLSAKPRSPSPWLLAVDLFTVNHEWQRLIDVLPEIKSHAHLSEQALTKIKFQAYRERFLTVRKSSAAVLYDYWRALDKAQRSDATVRLAYAFALKKSGDKEACAKVIYKGLKRGEVTIEQANAHDVLCASYPKLVEFVQEALKRNAQHSGYIRALAILAYDSKDYSLAQRALKKLVEQEATATDYRLLGDVYHALGDSQLAANAYKKALADADV